MSSRGSSGEVDSVSWAPGLQKTLVYRIIVAQLTVTVFFASTWLLLFDRVIAYSTLLGGLVAVLPNWLLALYWMNPYPVNNSRVNQSRNKTPGFREIWIGESGKIGLSALMFLLIFWGVKPLNLGFLFGTFGLLQLAPLVLNFIHDPIHKKKNSKLG